MILHLLCDAQCAEPLFSIAVEMTLSNSCYIFLIATEVLWKYYKLSRNALTS